MTPSRSAGSLPATKFALPPAQAGMIVRNRLLEALDDGIRRPLTLISAPPGAGKTALLGSWIGAARAPGAVGCRWTPPTAIAAGSGAPSSRR